MRELWTSTPPTGGHGMASAGPGRSAAADDAVGPPSPAAAAGPSGGAVESASSTYVFISSVTGEGITALKDELWKALNN